jgi:uncharacterized membrane protein YfcA
MNDWSRILAVGVPLVTLIGVDKGGFAGAFGLLAVPLMALVVPPFEAAAILLPILLVMDGYGVWLYRRTWNGARLAPLLAGAVVGLAVAWTLADRISAETVRLLIGAMSLLFVIVLVLRPRARALHAPGRVAGVFCGVLAGFASFIAHAGGPPFQIYMVPQRLDRQVFVGTSVMFFATLNVLKVVPYASLGLFDPRHVTVSLALVPFGPLGILLGRYAVKRVPERPFYWIIQALLAVVGAKLVWGALG